MRDLGRFTVTVRPLVWLRNMAVAAAAGMLLIVPSPLSGSATAGGGVPIVAEASRPEPTEAELRRAKQLSMVTSELEGKMTKAEPGELAKVAATIVDESNAAQFDPLLVLAIIEVESRYDIEAVSPTGCRGLMQVCPGTFKRVSDAKRMFDPVNNVRAGVEVLRRNREAGFKRPETILLAYNQGPAVALAVHRDGQEPPEEGAIYVPTVMARYKTLLARYGFNPKDARKLFSTAPVPEERPTARRTKSQVAKKVQQEAPAAVVAAEPQKEAQLAVQEDHPLPPTVVAEAMPEGDVPPVGDGAEARQ